jgi:putative tricarboxylic transport membrane protein
VTALGDGPYKSLKDLAEAAEKNSGQIGLAMGAGTLAQYVSVMVAEAMNVDMKYVNCGDDAEKKAAVLGGHVAAMIGPLPGVVPLHKAGKFRILAVLSPERLKSAQDIPTAMEQGYEVTAFTPNGIMVAKNTPQDRVDKIASAFRKLGDDAAYQKAIDKLMVVWNFIEGEAYGERMNTMYQKMADLKKRAGF